MPYNYAKETGDILSGAVLPHDDSVNDRSPGSKLNNSQEVTQDIWKGKKSYIFCCYIDLVSLLI